MHEIIPTILTSDIEVFSQKINSIKGICQRVQIDVVDGKFTETKSVEIGAIKDLVDLGELKIDLHMMVEEPQGWINRALEIIPDRIIGHVEKMADPSAFIKEVVESGTQVGLAIDLETPVEGISDDLYLLADIVVLLGVKAGKGGQEFNSVVIDKVKKIRKLFGKMGSIGVDGGLNEENILKCKDAGANVFYVGSSFWQTEDLRKRYNELLKLIG